MCLTVGDCLGVGLFGFFWGCVYVFSFESSEGIDSVTQRLL